MDAHTSRGTNMSRAIAKILMSRGSKDEHPELKTKRQQRYNFRQRAAEQRALNFRYRGDIVRAHSIHKLLKLLNYNYTPGAHGLCAVCGREAQVCTCKIIVQDSMGTVIKEM